MSLASASQDPKSSILKRKEGFSLKTKTVRFDTERSGHNHCVRPSSALDASMVTQSWSAKASKRKKAISKKVPEVASLPTAEVASIPTVEEEFEVEAILDHRKCGGDYLYLLKWKGYREEDNTWEPSSNLFCNSILDAYRREHGLPSPRVTFSREEPSTSQNGCFPKISTSKSSRHKRKHRNRVGVVFRTAPDGSINGVRKRKRKRRRKLIVSIALTSGVQVGQQHHSLNKKQTIASIHRQSSASSDESYSPVTQSFIYDQPPPPSIEHRLCCLRHDHPYSKMKEDKLLPLKLPLTPPHSGKLEDVSSFCPHDNGVSSIDISPPPTPLSPKLGRLKMRFEPPANESDLDSPLHYTGYDYPRNSSPILSSPLGNAFKLTWSSASSLSSDFESCPKEDKVPSTTKPQQETKEKHNVTFTYKGTRPHKSSSMSLNNLLSRCRKGPLPLPRSFSKWQSTTNALLQTRAAKLDGVSSAQRDNNRCSNGFSTDVEGKLKLKEFSLSLKNKALDQVKVKHVLAPLNQNDENCCDQPAPRKNEHLLQEGSEYSSTCAYKEQLMEWQYELNKQRDGTDDIIFVENDVDMAPPPTDFNYVCANVYREGVPNPSNPEVSSSLCGCECYNLGRKCGPKSEFCCAHMAGSKFAYSPAGKVKVPPGTPIYECNAECSCPSDCLNRIVQLGRKMPLCIFRTNGRGWGVKTVEPIKPNTFVTEYVGEVITNEEAEKRGKKCDAEGITYLFDLDFEDENSAFTIDAKGHGNISHFFNHSCDPNLIVYSVWIDTLDKRLPRLAFFTTRNISVGEELTFDYQMNRDSTSGPKMPCLCGSKNCLGYIN